MAAEKTDEKKPAKSQGSAGNEDGKVLVSLADIQKMIEDAIEQHDREKGIVNAQRSTAEETEEQKQLREYYEEKVTINLFLDNDKYKDDVIVNVNGKAWQIQRGVDVEVHRYVAQVLDNSVKQDRATALKIRVMESDFEKTLK